MKIIIGLMYLRRTRVLKEEVLKMLRIDKKEKEKIKRMYKDNPLIQYIAETIFEDELKKYQEKLEQKEEQLKQKEIEKEREIIEILLRIKIRENIDHIILKI